MTKKIITGVIAAILLVTIAVFAAEKAKEKAFAEKPCPKARTGELQEQHEGLLDQLAEAYKANDRQKMGEIINKMQERREKMGKFAKLNRWHKWAHRRMMGQMQMGPGWGQDQQMTGQGFNQGCAMQGQGWNQGCAMNGPCGNRGWAMRGQGPNQSCPMAMAGPQCGQFQPMRGRGFGGCNNMMGNYCPMAGGFGQMPCQQGSMGMNNCMPQQGGQGGQMPCQQGGMDMDNCMPQQNGPGQMGGWERGGFRENCAPRQDAGDMEQQGCNMPRRERQNVPPTEWGW